MPPMTAMMPAMTNIVCMLGSELRAKMRASSIAFSGERMKRAKNRSAWFDGNRWAKPPLSYPPSPLPDKMRYEV
jgi:hypothetical protein